MLLTANQQPSISQHGWFQDSAHRMWHTLLPKRPSYITHADSNLPTTANVQDKGTPKLQETWTNLRRTDANGIVHTVIVNSSPHKGQFKHLITQHALVKLWNSMNLIWQICSTSRHLKRTGLLYFSTEHGAQRACPKALVHQGWKGSNTIQFKRLFYAFDDNFTNYTLRTLISYDSK